RLTGLLLELVDALAFLVDDLAKLTGDVVVDAAEVVLLEFVLAPPPQPLHQLAHTGQPLAVLVAEPGLHHPAQRGVEVAVVQQVVGDLGEDVVGVELEAGLCAVPAAVAETDGHRTGPSPDPATSPWSRRRPCSSA